MRYAIAPHSTDKHFRISIDDNIWWLRDVARSGAECLFDNAYLATLRSLHEESGTVFHLNVYSACPEGDFDLTRFPDRYIDQFEANRDWLRLSFHARTNEPDNPYLNASYDEVLRDCLAVRRELSRFAGRAQSEYVTTLHWGAATADGVRALRDAGYRALLGFFTPDEDGKPRVSYHASLELCEAVRRNAFVVDPETGVTFFSCELVLNSLTPEGITRKLDAESARYPGRPFLDLLMHEQYFYPYYVAYLPDWADRIRAGVAWCLANGYRPGFATEQLGLPRD